MEILGLVESATPMSDCWCAPACAYCVPHSYQNIINTNDAIDDVDA